ncbi:MAG: histidinol-phosphatase [Clostridia bacterium]|nr:histidinol-phosphatase [Clostridia bacterium]
MPVRSNVHTHTSYSDGADPPREMVEEALARGFLSLGFSDHGWSPYDVCSMSREKEALYRSEIRALEREYAGRIEIALGYEHDATVPGAELGCYDYVIESVHFLERGGEYRSVDESPEKLEGILREWYGGDAGRMCGDYFRSVCQALSRPDIHIAGHIDLISKFTEAGALFDPLDAGYLRAAEEALEVAVSRDLLVEINTGAMSRGWRSQPYPSGALLKRCRALGGRIIVTSDCHRREWLDHGFDRAVRLAAACGFRERWTWLGGRFVPVPLE